MSFRLQRQRGARPPLSRGWIVVVLFAICAGATWIWQPQARAMLPLPTVPSAIATPPVEVPAPTPLTTVVAPPVPVSAPALAPAPIKEPVLAVQTYHLIFGGQTLAYELPSYGAQVTLHVRCGAERRIVHEVTDESGHYSFELSMPAVPGEPLYWYVHAKLPGAGATEVEGRRTLPTERKTLTFKHTLNFVQS